MLCTLSGRPGLASIDTYLWEHIKEAANHVAARNRPNSRLASGSTGGRFTDHESRTLDIQLQHFGIVGVSILERRWARDLHRDLRGRAHRLISLAAIG